MKCEICGFEFLLFYLLLHDNFFWKRIHFTYACHDWLENLKFGNNIPMHHGLHVSVFVCFFFIIWKSTCDRCVVCEMGGDQLSKLSENESKISKIKKWGCLRANYYLNWADRLWSNNWSWLALWGKKCWILFFLQFSRYHIPNSYSDYYQYVILSWTFFAVYH